MSTSIYDMLMVRDVSFGSDERTLSEDADASCERICGLFTANSQPAPPSTATTLKSAIVCPQTRVGIACFNNIGGKLADSAESP